MPERLCMSELYDRVRHCWTSVLRHMFHGGANICHLRHVRPDVDTHATGQKTLRHDAGFRHIRIEAIPRQVWDNAMHVLGIVDTLLCPRHVVSMLNTSLDISHLLSVTPLLWQIVMHKIVKSILFHS